MDKKKEKLVLCYECSKPIHIDDLGAVTKINNKEAWFHKKCYDERDDSYDDDSNTYII